ncbi:hypothetical protein [Pararhodobacter oceanensis]|uniref:hypothetical protein n=1 Tax=Pararhodobacter oceanensis TaxID=2172121 RepID=UPI003A94B893
MTEGMYQGAAIAIGKNMEKTPEFSTIMVEGLNQLDRGSIPFIEMGEKERETQVRKIANTSFIRISLRFAKRFLYDQPEVWGRCGYDGVSGCSDSVPRKDFGMWEG